MKAEPCSACHCVTAPASCCTVEGSRSRTFPAFSDRCRFLFASLPCIQQVQKHPHVSFQVPTHKMLSQIQQDEYRRDRGVSVCL